MRYLTIFASGVLFAAGLAIAGMTQPSKVIGFLDITGDWDPSLALVMVGAILVHSISYRFAMRRSSPTFAAAFQIPTKSQVDGRLIVGAILFGLGWGLGGYCPGPAVSAALVGDPATLTFLASLVVTMMVYSVLSGRVAGTTNRDPGDGDLGSPRVVPIDAPRTDDA